MAKTKQVLVTGGAGYIGSHTCKELAISGFEPITYDNLSTGHRGSVKWGPLVEGDVLDSDCLASAIRQYGPETVIHFAASAYVGESISDPAKYYRNNVGGMLSLLAACRSEGLRSVIFSSSCATYGIPENMPITETTVQIPINPYGRTKLIGEQMLDDYARAYGLRYVSLRYFNACGADPDGETGEFHDPETHLIPLALKAAADRRNKLDIFGTNYQTPDGTCLRDYIHVSDLARAHVLAMNYLLDGGKNISANLGTGSTYSVRQILDSITRITGNPINANPHPRREGDPPVLCADTSRAKEVLGFETEHSNLDEIITTAAPFFGLEVHR
ncbi:MAG: UDP-glucose 4-epimerase GalE [Hyphomicrobiales bacterium]|nr:UDP-glucose 4-epimerase GalE [Hyphomicrobiales bacterium]